MQPVSRVPAAAARLAHARAGPPSSTLRLALATPTPARMFSDAYGRPIGRRRERLPPNLGFTIVPQQKAYIVERLGKYHATLEPGFHFLIPFLDRVAYVQSLKEEAVPIPGQTAITRDNVTLQIDGVLYIRTLDPYAASYGVEDAVFALVQLAQTTMRSELGKITLDRSFEERESLNHAIVQAINAAATTWGVQVLRYEIRDISPPASVKAAMDLQAEAERRKRAEILDSEGQREAAINRAEGQRASTVKAAQGEAEAILARARASAAAVQLLASAVSVPGGPNAVALRVAEQYVSAFARLAQRGNTVILPANVGDVSGMVAQAMGTYSAIAGRLPPPPAHAAVAAGAGGDVADSDPLLVAAMDGADAATAAGAAGGDAASDLASLMAGLGPADPPAPPAVPAFVPTAPAQPGAAGGGGGAAGAPAGDRFVPKPF